MPSSCFLLHTFKPPDRQSSTGASAGASAGASTRIDTDTDTVSTMATQPANNDIARAMYYLHCITTACGLDMLPPDLVDFENYYTLSPQRREAVILATWAFSPAVMSRKTLYEDTTHTLLPRRSKFRLVDLSSTPSQINPRQTFRLHGQTVAITSIIIYKPVWLHAIRSAVYKPPVIPLLTRALRAHCVHCLWDGPCQCRTFGKRRRECARTPHAKCTPFPANLLAHRNHCPHCIGHAGRCRCPHGCKRPPDVFCFERLRKEICHECGMRGRASRVPFSCCDSCAVVCDQCLRVQAFAWWHAFVEVDRASGGGVDAGRRKQVRVDSVHHPGVVAKSIAEQVNVDALTARMAMLNSTVEASFAQGVKTERKRTSIVQSLLARFDGGAVPKRGRTALPFAQADQAERVGSVGRAGRAGRVEGEEDVEDVNGAASQTGGLLMGDRVVLENMPREDLNHISGVVTAPDVKRGFARVSLDADKRVVCVKHDSLKKIS